MKATGFCCNCGVFGILSALAFGILVLGQIPAHAATDTARVAKYAQSEIVSVKGRPTDASEMAKRWFKSQISCILPEMQSLGLGAAASRFWVPQKKNRAEKGDISMSYFYETMVYWDANRVAPRYAASHGEEQKR